MASAMCHVDMLCGKILRKSRIRYLIRAFNTCVSSGAINWLRRLIRHGSNICSKGKVG